MGRVTQWTKIDLLEQNTICFVPKRLCSNIQSMSLPSKVSWIEFVHNGKQNNCAIVFWELIVAFFKKRISISIALIHDSGMILNLSINVNRMVTILDAFGIIKPETHWSQALLLL